MWKIIQCAVQGLGHISSDTPCQDKTFSCSKNGVNIIALADGAGSAKLSHFGAEEVTKFICREMSDQFDEYYTEDNVQDATHKLMSGIKDTLVQTSKEHECDIKDLASTLLFAAVKNDRYILAHIGDGIIGYYINDEVKTASQPSNGEFANTTFFTTSKDAEISMKMFKGMLGGIKGFFLMSDGSQTSLYDKRKNVPAQSLKKIMDMCTYIRLDKIQEILQRDFEKNIRNKTNDDCSIAILMNSNDEFQGYCNMDEIQKRQLLQIKKTKTCNNYDKILLKCLKDGSSIDEIAKHVNLKPRTLKYNYLSNLCKLNFIECVDKKYKTILIMDVKNIKNTPIEPKL